MSAKSSKSRASHRRLFLVGKDAPFQFVEAYKSLRTNLEFLSATSNCKTILITSSVPEEGKSNVAINLAMTLAASNKRVILVDCDMRKSAISRYLRIPRTAHWLQKLLDWNLVHLLCTDAHSMDTRPPNLAAGYSKLPSSIARRLRRNGIEVYLGNDLVPPEPTKPKYRFGHWV